MSYRDIALAAATMKSPLPEGEWHTESAWNTAGRWSARDITRYTIISHMPNRELLTARKLVVAVMMTHHTICFAGCLLSLQVVYSIPGCVFYSKERREGNILTRVHLFPSLVSLGSADLACQTFLLT